MAKKIYKNAWKIFRWAVVFLLLELGLLLQKTEPWAQKMFGGVSMEEIIFHLKVPLQGTDVSTIYSFIQDALVPSIIELLFLLLLFVILPRIERAVRSRQEGILKKSVFLQIKSFRKPHRVSVRKAYIFCKIPYWLIFVFSLAVFLWNTYSICETYSVRDYIKQQMDSSTWIEEQYVQPEESLLTWPDEKRNLIYIFLESMESTYTSQDNGGAFEVDLIPELTKLANDNISFSDKTGLLGGTIPIAYTGWTIAGMFAQTSGLPLKIPINGNAMEEYSVFFPGVTSLGELLEEEGYHNCLLIGSDAVFGGRKNYFEQHGNYEICDYNWAMETGVIPQGYHVFWGMEDSRLIEAAKDKLLELSANDEPFNLTMLTVDTHFPDGYRCDLCENEHDTDYKDAISCSSRQIYNFIQWIQEQDFYENTTIILSGDHVTMSSELIEEALQYYDRRTYNCIINSAVSSENSTRIFTSMDMFPTTLAAMGVEISGDRLALGTNLFGERKTLTEEFGYEFENTELQKNSTFYNDVLLYTE